MQFVVVTVEEALSETRSGIGMLRLSAQGGEAMAQSG